MVLPVLLFGTGVSFFWPAITACMGDTVEPDRQANGAALFQIALNLTRSFAPFVGAGLVAWQVTGFTGSYLAVALVMVGTLTTIAFIPTAKPGDIPGAAAEGPDEVRNFEPAGPARAPAEGAHDVPAIAAAQGGPGC